MKHKKANHFCDVCGMFFKQANNFRIHREDHERGFNPKCDFCKRKFVTSLAKMRHMVKKHNVQWEETNFVQKVVYKCTDCSKVYKYEDQLNEHDMKHHRERCSEQTIKSYTCTFCFKICIRKTQLKDHIKEVHINKPLQCETCGNEFTRQKALDVHIANFHSSLNPEICQFCNATFVTKTQLKRHEQQQHQERIKTEVSQNDEVNQMNIAAAKRLARERRKVRLFPCRYCGEATGSEWKRRAHYGHIHKHGKKPQRTCNTCQLDFLTYDNFKSHIDAHDNILICAVCGDTTASKQDLISHIAVHKVIQNDDRKFSCDICGHRSVTKGNLSTHMRNHTNHCPYICATCGRGFKFKPCLSYHQKKCAGEWSEALKKFVCETCAKDFLTRAGLIDHQRIHTNERPFECKVCKRGFMTKLTLKHHYQTHEETRACLRCEICNITFKYGMVLRSHDLKHHPEKFPFRCQFCVEVFKKEGGLRAHMTTKHADLKVMGFIAI